MTLPHTMLDSAYRLLAMEYAQGLEPGATVDEYDLAYCAPFLAYLPSALAHHGLQLVGTKVQRMEERT
jgi:hypothetical protein